MAKQLRDFYSRAVVADLAAMVAEAHPLDQRRFVAEALRGWGDLSLTQRSQRIAATLRDHLPEDYPAALAVLLGALPPDDGSGGVEGMEGFRFLPLLNFVGRYGLDHPRLSLEALATLTRYFSAEFDVRPYLLRHPRLALAAMRRWSKDPDWRLRRLASEGSRPRLPWGIRLQPFIEDPQPALQLIEPLREDPHPVVRRSVANHLNDVAKDHPDLVAATAEGWLRESRPRGGANAATRGIVRHALRTLVKQGHPGALAALGYRRGAKVAASPLRLSARRVLLGEALEFSVTLRSEEAVPAALSIDYRIHHVRARGGTTAKVFKLARRTLLAGGSTEVSRRHPIVPITTRRYYSGQHKLEILVNGAVVAAAEFELVVPDE